MSDQDRRPWVKLDVGYFRNMKVVRVSNDAKVLHLTLIAWSAEQRTDGVVPVQMCKQMGDEPFRELTSHKLLIKHGKEFAINDYLKHQTPAKIISEKASKGAHVRWHEQKGVTSPGCQYCKPSYEDGPPVNFDNTDLPPF